MNDKGAAGEGNGTVPEENEVDIAGKYERYNIAVPPTEAVPTMVSVVILTLAHMG